MLGMHTNEIQIEIEVNQTAVLTIGNQEQRLLAAMIDRDPVTGGKLTVTFTTTPGRLEELTAGIKLMDQI